VLVLRIDLRQAVEVCLLCLSNDLKPAAVVKLPVKVTMLCRRRTTKLRDLS
jgi:hypothetical protein